MLNPCQELDDFNLFVEADVHFLNEHKLTFDPSRGIALNSQVPILTEALAHRSLYGTVKISFAKIVPIGTRMKCES